MIQSALKTLSLSLGAVAMAASASAHYGSSTLDPARVAPLAAQAGCSPQQVIDRGWELQRELLEARLAAKGPESVEVPGTIIAPPFPGFGPQGNAGSKGRLEITKAPAQESR